MIFFSGLIVGCIDGYYTEHYSYFSMWLSLLIPLSSMVRYQLAKHYILSNSVDRLKRGVSFKNAREQAVKLEAAQAEQKRRESGDSNSVRSSLHSNVMNKSGADVDGNDLCEFFTPGLTGTDVMVNKAIIGSDQFPSATGSFHDNQLWFSMGHRKDAMSEDAKASKIRADAAKVMRTQGKLFYQPLTSSGRLSRITAIGGATTPLQDKDRPLNL